MATSLRYQAVKQGGPWELVTGPRPVIKEGDEVLIRTKAVALHPMDWKRLDWGFMVAGWPAIFGLDGAGVVEEVGSNVKNFKPGDAVFGHFSPSFQEYSVGNESKLVKKPETWTFEEVATLPVAYITAVSAIHLGLGIALPFLVPYGGPKEGFQPKSVLVLGGSSSVGATVIELLRIASPNTTIITTSSEKHHKHLKELGADKTFDRSVSVDEIRAAAPGSKGVDAILDTVGAAGANPSVLDAFDPAGSKKFSDVETGTNAQTVPDGINRVLVRGANMYGAPGGEGVFDALAELMASKKFTLPVPATVRHGYEEISKGLVELKQGVSGTRLVVAL